MSGKTDIEWTDSTWNPVTGCTKVSAGCDHCYAETFAERWRGTPGHYFENGFDVQLRPDKLDWPLRKRKPQRIFVNSMSDLFHDSVPDEYIAEVFAVMAAAPQHTFQVLTKRHARMRSLVSSQRFWADVEHGALDQHGVLDVSWPLPNVWLGVSTENQQWADIRIPALLDTPAAVRFISAEPLLGPIDIADELTGAWGADRLDWVIVGGESGRGARPMHPCWARSLQQQCETAGVPYLFKQWGEWTPLAPLVDGKFDFRGGIVMTDDGDLYYPDGDLYYPDGPRRGEAHRRDSTSPSTYHRPTAMYRLGKKAAGRELDGRTWDEYPEVNA